MNKISVGNTLLHSKYGLGIVTNVSYPFNSVLFENNKKSRFSSNDELPLYESSLNEVIDKKLYEGLFDDWTKAKGESYFKQGRVNIIASNENEVTAIVEGTESYLVTLKYNKNRLTSKCVCPVSGVCKHMYATYLKYNSLLNANVEVERKETIYKKYIVNIISNHLGQASYYENIYNIHNSLVSDLNFEDFFNNFSAIDGLSLKYTQALQLIFNNEDLSEKANSYLLANINKNEKYQNFYKIINNIDNLAVNSKNELFSFIYNNDALGAIEYINEISISDYYNDYEMILSLIKDKFIYNEAFIEAINKFNDKHRSSLFRPSEVINKIDKKKLHDTYYATNINSLYFDYEDYKELDLDNKLLTLENYNTNVSIKLSYLALDFDNFLKNNYEERLASLLLTMYDKSTSATNKKEIKEMVLKLKNNIYLLMYLESRRRY